MIAFCIDSIAPEAPVTVEISSAEIPSVDNVTSGISNTNVSPGFAPFCKTKPLPSTALSLLPTPRIILPWDWVPPETGKPGGIEKSLTSKVMPL
ncbi:hypothetical protein D3C77_530980 [compost metagenome]